VIRRWSVKAAARISPDAGASRQVPVDDLDPPLAARCHPHVVRHDQAGGAREPIELELVVDAYGANRAGGSFILIDEANHHTVAAGMISDVGFRNGRPHTSFRP
jgi:sulfate adenylyltransferase subunit 1 (EFTu-like GTPase family)